MAQKIFSGRGRALSTHRTQHSYECYAKRKAKMARSERFELERDVFVRV
jgi:hypothetical protein